MLSAAGFFFLGPLPILAYKGRIRLLRFSTDPRKKYIFPRLEVVKAIATMQNSLFLINRAAGFASLDSLKFLFDKFHPSLPLEERDEIPPSLPVFKFLLQHDDLFVNAQLWNSQIYEAGCAQNLPLVRFLLIKGYDIESAEAGAIDSRNPDLLKYIASLNFKGTRKSLTSSLYEAQDKYNILFNKDDLDEEDEDGKEYQAAFFFDELLQDLKKTSLRFARCVFISDLIKQL